MRRGFGFGSLCGTVTLIVGLASPVSVLAQSASSSVAPSVEAELTSVPNLIPEEPFAPNAEEVKLDEFMTGSIMNPNELLNYCFNIADEATEARHAVLTEHLGDVESKVDAKLDELEARIHALKTWIERREAFLKNANDSLVEIFQSMRPDSAASQLTEIGPGLAAAIISKLEPKYSSAILAEMKPSDAAKIATVLTGVLEAENAKN